MATWGSCNFTDLEKFRDNIEKLSDTQTNAFFEECAKELAARLLAKAIKRTPVGQYEAGSGKTGGTLRRGWTTQSNGSGSEGLQTRGAKQFADSLKINHFDGYYVIEITNPVEYASYVEYGHRTRDHKGWVKGRFMMTISEKEVNAMAPGILTRKLEKFLKGAFNA